MPSSCWKPFSRNRKINDQGLVVVMLLVVSLEIIMEILVVLLLVLAALPAAAAVGRKEKREAQS